ncbi:MAG: M23 family metallopeptidase [Arcicella sp.]|nr:M23 family metallopeptidase [Arcicella sp.]
MKKIQIFILFSFLIQPIQAQKTQLFYPKGYFLFPINPNQQNYLAGGMGDLRADHFHAGIDIKTQGREGLPVYATADGYISEVRVQTSGYGNVIFITHPNGFVSVYGHLKEFAEPLATYVRKKRLENQTFEIKVLLNPTQFEVSRGQVIGLSGNTGGSGGPHLHFEIRDTRNNILNPLNFGFSEIKDNLPPIFQQLIIKTLTIDSRVNGEFGKKLFYPVKQANGTYSLNTNVSAIGEIGLELLAVDKMNGTNNSNGLTCVEMFVDGVENYYSHLESYPNTVSHDINVHNDYAIERTQGNRIQKLFQDDGNNELPIYKPAISKGKLFINDGKTHQISIKIWDAYDNGSELNFTIKGEKNTPSLSVNPNALPVLINTEIDENTLIIKARNLKSVNSLAKLKFKNTVTDLSLNYVKNNEAVYLWDLRKNLPDSVSIDGLTKPLFLQKMLIPNQEDSWSSDKLSVNFEANSLYDTLYLQTNVVGNLFQIGQNTVPLRNGFSANYEPDFRVIEPDKTSVYYVFKNGKSFLKTSWKNNKASFKAPRLGNFEVLLDSIPPSASIVRKKPDDFSIRINDKLSGIKSFKAFVNDEYVLTDYDYKRNLLWSVKSDSTQRFIGKLRVELEDNQGNKSAFETTIDSVSVVSKPVKIIEQKFKKQAHEPKNRRQSPPIRAKKSKRRNR